MAANKDNIKIAKNTVVVYVRLIVTAIVGLLTSRYVLQILGASDFGLYSVIGGVIAMFTFIAGSLQATTIRFINYEMGRPDGDVNRIFNTVLQIHVLFAIVIFVLAEVLGLYYIYNYLNVESGKLDDALFVFHCSMTVACLGIVNVPYQGLLIAHEKFFLSACIDIVNVLCKLIMVFMLFFATGNVLRLYAIGMSLLTFLSFMAYFVACRICWPSEIRQKLVKSIAQHKEILIFNNYTLLSTASLMARNQGSNLLINYFFGTVVNAAYVISNMVLVYVNMFAGCFDQASAPQITQNLSRGDRDRTLYLVNHTCRICILLVEIVYFAMMADLDFILHLWLGERVPESTDTFCHLTLLLAVVSATSGGLAQYINAIGRLKWFSIWMSTWYMIGLVVAVFLYKNHVDATSILIVFIVADLVNRVCQLLLLRRLSKFPVLSFVREAYLRPMIVFVIGCGILFAYQNVGVQGSLWRFTGIVSIAVLMALIVFYIGMYKNERIKIQHVIINKIKERR
jgi:O-antigen/teichoic acid export membrane protein